MQYARTQVDRAPLLEVEGGNIRGMQRFISDVTWDEEHRVWTYHHLVAEDLGDPNRIVMFDETGFVKKGKESAGWRVNIVVRWAKWSIAKWSVCTPATLGVHNTMHRCAGAGVSRGERPLGHGACLVRLWGVSCRVCTMVRVGDAVADSAW